MRFYRQPDHVGFCVVGDRTIFLDLRSDRYFGLPAVAERAFARLISAHGVCDGDIALEPLVKRGLLVPAGAPEPLAPAAPFIPNASLADRPSRARAPAATAMAELLWRLHRIRRSLRAGRLEALARALRERKRPAGTVGRNLGDEVARAMAARRFLPIAPNCLPDSLALAAYLARRSIFPSLVFGVKLDPFAAHCWLQDEHAVLNDSADRVRDFTPVLVV